MRHGWLGSGSHWHRQARLRYAARVCVGATRDSRASRRHPRHHNVSKIDLLDIDAEGVDLAVLRSNDWSRRRPIVIAIEDHDMILADVQKSEIYRFLSDVGYDLHSKVHYTAIYVARR